MTMQEATPAAAPVVVALAPLAREAVPAFSKAFAMAEKGEESAVAKAHKRLAKALDAAAQTKLDLMVTAARLLGDVHLSSLQYDAQVRDDVKRVLEASGLSDVASAAKRAKALTLAVLSGDETLLPVGGEKSKAYFDRLASALPEAKLPDGRFVLDRNADGTIAGKTGKAPATAEEKAAKEAAKAEKAKAEKAFKDALTGDTGSAGNVTAGGQQRSATLAAAIILFGDTENARRLETIATTYRDEFTAWAREVLDEEETEAERQAMATAQAKAAEAARALRNAKPAGLKNGAAN